MSTELSTSSRPQAITPSRVTDKVKNGCDTRASPQSRISCRSPFTNTCPSWRSSCWSVSGTPYDASSSAISRTRGTASRNRSPTSPDSTRSAYRSGSTASRRSGHPGRDQAVDVRLHRACDVRSPVQHVDPSGQVPLLGDHLAQPRAGVVHQQPAAVRVVGDQGRNAVGHALCHQVRDQDLVDELLGVGLEPDGPSVGRHLDRRRPRPDVHLVGITGPGTAGLDEPTVDPVHGVGQPVRVAPPFLHGSSLAQPRAGRRLAIDGVRPPR